MNDIPVTIEFGGTPNGRVQLTDFAKKMFEDMKVGGADYVLAPSFIVKRQSPDGTIEEAELIELSVIPAARAVKRD